MGRGAKQNHASGCRAVRARLGTRWARQIADRRKLAISRCGLYLTRQWSRRDIVHQFLSASLYPAAKCG